MIAASKSKPNKAKTSNRGRGRPVGTTGRKHKRPDGNSIAGVIQDGESLRRDAFMLRLGIGDAAFRTMIKQGLRVKEVGRWEFISGRVFNDFIAGSPSVDVRDSIEDAGPDGSP